ncbi:hypothetical protein CB1_000282003 [Camelus ferus]|nr:hypothetical protein CB1_000282003 [Camelus ferus]
MSSGLAQRPTTCVVEKQDDSSKPVLEGAPLAGETEVPSQEAASGRRSANRNLLTEGPSRSQAIGCRRWDLRQVPPLGPEGLVRPVPRTLTRVTMGPDLLS